MKHIIRPFFASIVVMALSAMAYGQAVSGAGGTPTRSGVGTDSMQSLNEAGYGSPGDSGTGAGAGTGLGAAGNNSPTTARSLSGKANGLNKGTNSGANSDVNSGPGGSMRDGR